MVLTTHAVVGATLGSALPNSPVLAFVVGFASHFVLDSLPHWDYPLNSRRRRGTDRLNDDLEIGRDFILDLFKIGCDFLIGCLLIRFVLIQAGNLPAGAVMAGALGAVLPDFLQFVYFKLRFWPFRTLQRFHLWVHSKYRLDARSLLGIFIQLGLVVAVLLAALAL